MRIVVVVMVLATLATTGFFAVQALRARRLARRSAQWPVVTGVVERGWPDSDADQRELAVVLGHLFPAEAGGTGRRAGDVGDGVWHEQ